MDKSYPKKLQDTSKKSASVGERTPTKRPRTGRGAAERAFTAVTDHQEREPDVEVEAKLGEMAHAASGLALLAVEAATLASLVDAYLASSSGLDVEGVPVERIVTVARNMTSAKWRDLVDAADAHASDVEMFALRGRS